MNVSGDTRQRRPRPQHVPLGAGGRRPDAAHRRVVARPPDPSPEQSKVIEFDWKTTVVEDLNIMDSVQRGLTSRGYRRGPLIMHPSGIADVHSENTAPHLHSLLLDALGYR